MREVNGKFGHKDASALTSLPTMTWSQIYQQLHPLLEARSGVDSSLVLQWSHQSVKEIAESGFLVCQQEAIYKSLSDYFSIRPEANEIENTLFSGKSKQKLLCYLTAFLPIHNYT